MTPSPLRLSLLFAAALTPAALMAFSSGPLPGHAGVNSTLAIDGAGRTCARCHANSLNFPGRVTLGVNGYSPGQKQTITVRIEDSTALRWGFQVTARRVDDETKPAGHFVSNENVRVRCPDGTDLPNGLVGGCGGQVQFAEHSATNTRRGSGGPQTFVIEWVPPGRDIGQVIFYVAANAADNSGTNTGDHIYTASLKVSAQPCNLQGTPFVSEGGLTNAASFATGVSPNSLISIFGGQFFPSDVTYRAQGSDLVGGKLQTDLGCLGVEIAGQRAPVFYVQSDQINAQAPLLTQTGSVPVRVILNPGTPNEVRSAPVNILATTVQPAMFKIDSKTIAGYNASKGNAILGLNNSTAAPGDIVVLYGTGFGLTDPVYQPGEFVDGQAILKPTPTAKIGNIDAEVQYAGLSPDAPGFFQFNLRVPAGVADGDQQVTITVNGLPSQGNATIPIKR